MFLDINTIGRERVSFDQNLVLADLEGAGADPLKVLKARLAGEMVRAGRGVEFDARLEARLVVSCSRCLESFEQAVDTEIKRLLIADPAGTDDTAPRVPDDEDDDETLRVAGGKVALEEIATEQIYLTLPLKPVCSPRCKGLCPRCGANRNVGACECPTEDHDPRLAPLLEFRRRQERS